MNFQNEIVSLYTGTGWKKVFARLRFSYAPYIETEKFIPKAGKILDLGCGEGIFTNYIGLTSKKRRVLGIEVDKKRVDQAVRGIGNVKFKLGDITRVDLPNSDGIIFFQVLHHLPTYELQELMIEKCSKSLKTGAKLIIVEIHVKPSIKYLLNWITDHLLVAWFFEKRLYTPIFFRKVWEWKKLLKKSDFDCKIIYPDEKFKPFPNVILDCTKI